jgi:glycosyltransferase involved in cell wall biosynthesis
MQRTEPARHLTVVQLLPALESGGVERGTLEVGKYLVDHGHRSIVISAGGRMVEQLQREGSEHLTWDIGRKSLFTLLRYVGRLRRFLRDEKVDILHIRSRMPGWVGYLAWKGMDKSRRPRLVSTVHGLYSVSAYSAVMVKGEAVIAVSETVRRYILDHYRNVAPERIKLIFRGVDRSQFSYGYQPSPEWKSTWHRQYPFLEGKHVITLPGRITRLKGHEEFLKLVADLKSSDLPIHGLIVGGAHADKQAYFDELKALAEQLGIGAEVTFTGQRADLREIMAVSRLVLSLSTQAESFGRTVLEALSLGIPVCGYNHGGVGEQLNTLLPSGGVPLGDTVSLGKTVRTFLESPPVVPPEHPFTLANMLETTLNVYMALCEEPPLAA